MRSSARLQTLYHDVLQVIRPDMSSFYALFCGKAWANHHKRTLFEIACTWGDSKKSYTMVFLRQNIDPVGKYMNCKVG